MTEAEKRIRELDQYRATLQQWSSSNAADISDMFDPAGYSQDRGTDELRRKLNEDRAVVERYIRDADAAASLDPFTTQYNPVDFIDAAIGFYKRSPNFAPKQSPETSPAAAGLEAVERICERFHAVVRAMRTRHDERAPFSVVDEYDVQDLLRCLLFLAFEDVREEEWTPSYAGSSARMDFFLKDASLVIEAKMTRKGLNAKKLGDELLVDVGRYRAHPGCRALVCFVYDPEGWIRNPAGIEKDLSKVHDGLLVRVYIRPR